MATATPEYISPTVPGGSLRMTTPGSEGDGRSAPQPDGSAEAVRRCRVGRDR